MAGHAGRFKTLELVSRNHWWPKHVMVCQPICVNL
jgi:hypothetical protein